jgi:hypothetical protein
MSTGTVSVELLDEDLLDLELADLVVRPLHDVAEPPELVSPTEGFWTPCSSCSTSSS